MGDVVVCVCYRRPDQGEVDEAFFTQLEESLCSEALFLKGDLKPPIICWKGMTAVHGKAKSFGECIDGTFLRKAM